MELLRDLDEHAVVDDLSLGTVQSYRSAIARFAAFGVTRAEDVSVARMAAFVAARARETRSMARQDGLALLSVLAYVERIGRALPVPLRALRELLPGRPPREQLAASYLTRERYEALKEGALSRRGTWGPRAPMKRKRRRLMIEIAALSGLRRGELARLDWSHVDLERKILYVRGRTKTRRERAVPICEELRAALAAWPERSGPVFPRHSGGYIHPKVLWRQLAIARAAAELADVDFHLLRHTRASWWVQNKVPLAKVAKWMGHSIEVCIDHYAGLELGYDPDCELAPAA